MNFAIIVGLLTGAAALGGVILGFVLGVKYTKKTAGMAGALTNHLIDMVKDKDRLLAEFASRVMAGPDLRAVAETEERLRDKGKEPKVALQPWERQ